MIWLIMIYFDDVIRLYATLIFFVIFCVIRLYRYLDSYDY